MVREGHRRRWRETVRAPMDELPEHKRPRGGLVLTLDGETIITIKDVCRLEKRRDLSPS
jgi:hypothetical protein